MKPLPHEAALWQWLVKAARCAAVDVARGRQRYAALLARWGEFFRRTTRDAERADDGLMQALESALKELSDKERVLIERKYFEGRKASELAASSGLTVKAV